jgi:nucleoside-diphosphate-sugar epimerase
LRVLITGADGFVGQHLQDALTTRGIEFRAAVRRAEYPLPARVSAIGDIGPATDWRAALDGIDVVVHLAGKAHVLRKASPALRDEFMLVNGLGTASLAHACAEAGVRRFVYLSSVGVLGSSTPTKPFTNASEPNPRNIYARSKLAGEASATSFADRLEVVIVRPPLVYGPRVKANFLRLLQLVDRGIPLPLGALRNGRSLVSVWNLCDLLVHALDHPAAPGRAWLVSDGHDVSTPQLLREIGVAMGKRTSLLPVPVSILEVLATMVGQHAVFMQLCGSLLLDIDETRECLGWSPPVTFAEGIRRTVEWYVGAGRRPRGFANRGHR